MTAPDPQEQRAFKIFAFVLALGMALAAVRAWTWSDEIRTRNLVVVAPEKTRMAIMDGPAPLNETHGVHTWSVQPGPLTLEVQFADQSKHQTKVIIPKGLGGLMLKISQAEAGELVLGYF